MNVRAVCILIALIVSISSPVPFHASCISASKLHAKLDCSGKGQALLIKSDMQYLFEDQFTLPVLENNDLNWASDPTFNQLLVDFQKERPPRILS